MKCNRCVFEKMKQARPNQVLLVKPDSKIPYFPDGVAVHSVSKEDYKETQFGERRFGEALDYGDPIAWFGELPEHCRCFPTSVVPKHHHRINHQWKEKSDL